MPITRHSRFVHKRKYAPVLFLLSCFPPRLFSSFVPSRPRRFCFLFPPRSPNVTRVPIFPTQRGITSRTRNREKEKPRFVQHAQRAPPRRQWGTIIDVRSIIEHRINQFHRVIALWRFERGIRPIFTSNRNHALASSIFHLVLRCANICFFAAHTCTLVTSLLYRIA